MLVLKATAPKPKYVPIELGDGVSLKVQVTPPTFAELLNSRYAETPGEAANVRLQCVTDWRDVFTETADGGRCELPFSRDAFQQFLAAYPAAIGKILTEAVNPLFLGEPKRTQEPKPESPTTNSI